MNRVPRNTDINYNREATEERPKTLERTRAVARQLASCWVTGDEKNPTDDKELPGRVFYHLANALPHQLGRIVKYDNSGPTTINAFMTNLETQWYPGLQA
jgi:hypothetical protein